MRTSWQLSANGLTWGVEWRKGILCSAGTSFDKLFVGLVTDLDWFLGLFPILDFYFCLFDWCRMERSLLLRGHAYATI